MISVVESVDFVKLRHDLSRAVSRICPAWLGNEHDDLVQAAVMRVLRVLRTPAAGSTGNDAQPASSYLYKVARSVLIDEIRRVRRRREDSLDEDSGEGFPAPDNPERAAASREIGRAIQSSLMHLPYERRLVVILYLQGHGVPEAARILDWPAKRTENLVYRGLAALRASLLSKGYGREYA